MKKKVDWVKIEREYVREHVSQRELAERHEVGLKQISRHAKAGEWVKKRKQFVHEMTTELEKLDKEAAVDKAAEYSEIMDKSLYIEKKLLEKTLKCALAIQMYEIDAIDNLKSAQNTIKSIVETTEKICFPEHEQTEQQVTISMDKETKDYAI